MTARAAAPQDDSKAYRSTMIRNRDAAQNLSASGYLQRTAELRAIAVADLDVVETLPRDDLIAFRRIRQTDRADDSCVDRREGFRVQLTGRNERPTDALDQ